MDQSEFKKLHATCVAALKTFITSAELTTKMLGQCSPKPMPTADRLSLMLQELAEADCHDAYRTVKRALHDAARKGYDSSN